MRPFRNDYKTPDPAKLEEISRRLEEAAKLPPTPEDLAWFDALPELPEEDDDSTLIEM